MFRRIKDRVKHKGHQKQPSSSTTKVGPAAQDASKTGILQLGQGDGKHNAAITVAPASTGQSENGHNDKTAALSQAGGEPSAQEGADKSDIAGPAVDLKPQTASPLSTDPKTNIADSSTFSPPSPSPPSPPPPYELSLWDRAYDALVAKDAKLVANYEKLLDAEVDSENLSGHEFDISDQITQAADVVLWAKDYISDAVSASPQASIVWAGVCLILPLLTAPHTANKANRDGFTYVTTRIQFYTSLEPLLQTPRPNQATADIKERLIDLYEKILYFQIRSILRFYQSNLRGYVEDLFQQNEWKKMQDEIKDLEAAINADLARMSELTSLQELTRLNKTCAGYLDKMQSLLSVTDQQLGVSRTHLGISKTQLTVVEEIRDIALQSQQDAKQQRLTRDEEKCLRLFRLTSSNKDITYEWYKNRVENRVEDTCQWFLQHVDFQRWLDQTSSPLLVSADPGCGKSVLAKYLVDHELPAKSASGTAICYFFFKDQDQNTARQALCAILHQLFTQNPALINCATDSFMREGPGLINSTASLWNIFRKAVHDPRAGPVTVVLDALDECAMSEFRDLMENLEELFPKENDEESQLKVIMTSRPYEQILLEFQPLLQKFPHVHIPGEEESETISQEVNSVIQYRVEQLAREKHLSDKLKTILAEKFLGMEHRTYLWVHLVFDYLKDALFKKTEKGIENAISKMPQTVNDAYESILARSRDRAEVRRILAIILAASAPLTLAEMNIAINIDGEENRPDSIDDLDLEDEDDFKTRLRSICGLFITINDRRIYLIHLTAREFLLRPDTSSSTSTAKDSLTTISPSLASDFSWHHSITTQEANRIFAKICILYLNCLDSEVVSSLKEDVRMDLLEYAAKNWADHFHEANVSTDDPLASIAFDICDSSMSKRNVWAPIFAEAQFGYSWDHKVLAGLLEMSYFGHLSSVILLLQRGADVNIKDKEYNNTPLSWAASGGHTAVIRHLLNSGATVNERNYRNETPLLLAARGGHVSAVEELLKAGADVFAKDVLDMTALHVATEHDQEAIIKMILQKGPSPCSVDMNDQTPFMIAIKKGVSSIIALYLQAGARIVPEEDYNRDKALCFAAKCGNKTLVKQSFDAGCNVNRARFKGRTALSLAVPFEELVQFLLSVGASVNSHDEDTGHTPLIQAALCNNEETIKLLIDARADVNAVDNEGKTALSHGVAQDGVVRLLLASGAKVDWKDNGGLTPLMWAAKDMKSHAIRLLIEAGADVSFMDPSGRNTLAVCAESRFHLQDQEEEIRRLLLEAGCSE
ncbi:hypothetical protein Sste5346_003957 [Sporothrix stenoceras]|uniref:Ankyrin repeat protein n=1 Tax=Sporothrix stenoceras TaxID=5173 RepID=A0ABR3ZDR4_9PEZI